MPQQQLPNFFTSQAFYQMQSQAEVLEMGFGQEFLDYYLIQQLTGGQNVFTNERYGKYKRLRHQTDYITFTLNAAGAAAGGVYITLTTNSIPANQTFARVGDVIKNQRNGTRGMVYSVAANQIVVEPMDGATVFASGTWALNDVCYNAGNLSTIFNSRGTDDFNWDLTEESFYCAIIRETSSDSRRDSGEWFYVQIDGQPVYSYSLKQKKALQRAFRMYNQEFWDGTNSLFYSTAAKGQVASSFGVDYGISLEGNPVPIMSLPSQAQFEAAIQNALTLTSGRQKIFVGGGDLFVDHIRAMYSPYILTAGVNNTFNVKAGQGINFTEFPLGRADIMLDYIPYFCNSYQNPQLTNLPSLPGSVIGNTGYIINLTPIPSQSGKMIPRIQNLWWSDKDLNGNGSKIVKCIPGMVGAGNIMNTGTSANIVNSPSAFAGVGISFPEGQNTSSNVDGSQCEFLLDGGHVMNLIGATKFKPYVA